MIDNKFLLDDKQIFEFIINGYMIFNPKFSDDFNKTILQKADALETNPGDNILDEIPELNNVWEKCVFIKCVLQMKLYLSSIKESIFDDESSGKM